MRAHLARAYYYQKRYFTRKALEKQNVMAIKIQRAFRGFLTRRVSVALARPTGVLWLLSPKGAWLIIVTLTMVVMQLKIRMKADYQRRWYATLRLQLAWYTYKKMFSTFLLLCTLREEDNEERANKIKAAQSEKYSNVQKIQTWFREHRERRRQTAAVKIQCWCRSAMGHDILSVLRKERWVRPRVAH